MGKNRPRAQPAGDHADDAIEGTAQNQLNIQHQLVAYALGLAPLPPRPHEGLLFSAGEGGTENYRIEGKAIGSAWCRAALGPNHADTRFWRRELLTYLRDEHNEWMGAEQCCDAAHHGMHLAGHGVPLLFASTERYRDEELLRELRWWFGGYFKVSHDYSTPSGKVYTPGCNIRGPRPAQPLWTAASRHYRGLPNPDAPRPKKLLNDRWLTGYWAITQPVVKLREIAMADSVPRMRCPMVIGRTEDGYVASIGRPTVGKVAEQWVCSKVVVRGEELVGVEKSWQGVRALG